MVLVFDEPADRRTPRRLHLHFISFLLQALFGLTDAFLLRGDPVTVGLAAKVGTANRTDISKLPIKSHPFELTSARRTTDKSRLAIRDSSPPLQLPIVLP